MLHEAGLTALEQPLKQGGTVSTALPPSASAPDELRTLSSLDTDESDGATGA
jgi:hypothetical protein